MADEDENDDDDEKDDSSDDDVVDDDDDAENDDDNDDDDDDDDDLHVSKTTLIPWTASVHIFKERWHLPKTMFLRSIKHVCKIKTSNISRDTCASVCQTRASAWARKCVENHSNSVDCGCAHIQRTLTSTEDDVLA